MVYSARVLPGATQRRGYALSGRLVLAATILAILPSSLALPAAPGSASRLDGTSSVQAREEAIGSIPFDQLDAAGQAKVQAVLSNVSLFRRMPIKVIQCDAELYSFLLQHPDVVVNIWQVLGVTQLQVREIGDNVFRVADSAGTSGTMQVLYASDDTHIVWGEGQYEGPLSLRPAKGSFLLVLRSGYLREENGDCYITSRLDCFLNMEPGATELVTKVLQPMVVKVADLNFVQTISFVGSLWRTAQINPRGIQRLSSKLAYVQPEVRQQFSALAQRIAAHNAETANAARPADDKVEAAIIASRPIPRE